MLLLAIEALAAEWQWTAWAGLSRQPLQRCRVTCSPCRACFSPWPSAGQRRRCLPAVPADSCCRSAIAVQAVIAVAGTVLSASAAALRPDQPLVPQSACHLVSWFLPSTESARRPFLFVVATLLVMQATTTELSSSPGTGWQRGLRAVHGDGASVLGALSAVPVPRPHRWFLPTYRPSCA
jgi:hypothetical protein